MTYHTKFWYKSHFLGAPAVRIPAFLGHDLSTLLGCAYCPTIRLLDQ
jgi:hypothetical protein